MISRLASIIVKMCSFQQQESDKACMERKKYDYTQKKKLTETLFKNIRYWTFKSDFL